MVDILLQTEALAVERGDRVLFRDLTFSVGVGSVTVVVGPNGAGKSSLLLALSGTIPVSGSCRLQGRELHGFSRMELAKMIAWQGELPPTEFGLTVSERLHLAAGSSDPSLLQAAVQTMELGLLLERSLGELSSGERQRVEIAAVMARDCPLWFFDEPTSHLDLRHQMATLQMLRREASKGRAIVTVLHDLQQAMAVANQAVLLDGEGAAEAGDAAGLLTMERLSRLFQVELNAFATDGGQSVILPDYRP